MTQSWKWIVSNPKVCGGEPRIKGTRVPVHLLLDSIAAEDSFEDILKAYPQLSLGAIKEAVEYASLAVQREILPLH